MGNIQATKWQTGEDVKVLVHEYEKASLQEVDEAYRTFILDFGIGKMTAGLDDFDAIFCTLLGDTAEHFDFWNVSKKGVVSPYAVFCAFYMMNRRIHRDSTLTSLDDKVSKVLEMFDFDQSQRMNSIEIQMALKVAVTASRMIIKATAGIDPKVNVVTVCDRLERELQCSPENDVPTQAVKQWLAQQSDVEAFLSNLCTVKLIGSEQRKVDEGIATATTRFMKLSNGKRPPCITSGEAFEPHSFPPIYPSFSLVHDCRSVPHNSERTSWIERLRPRSRFLSLCCGCEWGGCRRNNLHGRIYGGHSAVDRLFRSR